MRRTMTAQALKDYLLSAQGPVWPQVQTSELTKGSYAPDWDPSGPDRAFEDWL